MKKCLILLIIPINIISEEIINLSSYEYPKKTNEEDSTYNVIIMGTNDIHGAFFPSKIKLDNNITFDYGGLEYMGKYISNLREEWGNRFLWLDSGDQFQGGLESRISYGDIITNFFNIMNLDGCTIGNHEWDYEIPYLVNRTFKSNFKYICANIRDSISKNYTFLPNQILTKIFLVDKVKIGVIGLTTITTKNTNSANLTQVDFLSYNEIIIQKSIELKKENVNAIILLLHIGVECPEIPIKERLKLGIYNKDSKFNQCKKEDELFQLLLNFNEENKYFDIIVSGHTHEIVHQWINGYPVISSLDQGKYFNLIYLYFSKSENYKFLKDKTIIEGPVPVCSKIFEKTLRCESGKKEEMKGWGNLKEFSFHNKKIEKEEKLQNLSDFWYKEYQNFSSQILTSTDNLMENDYLKENILSNFYTDTYRIITGSDISILNPGYFRTKWNQGNITVADLFQMEPFDNEITSFEMNGKELIKMMKLVHSQNSIDAIFPTSGLKQVIKENGVKNRFLLSIKLFDGFNEREIEEDKFYKIATVSFIIPGGGDVFKKVLKWYKIRNLKKYGDSKNIMIDYLKNIKKIETGKFIDKDNPRFYFK